MNITNKYARNIAPVGNSVFHDETLSGSGVGNDVLRVSYNIKLRNYTPTGPNDDFGSIGQMAWDDDYLYIKTSSGWASTSLTLLT